MQQYILTLTTLILFFTVCPANLGGKGLTINPSDSYNHQTGRASEDIETCYKIIGTDTLQEKDKESLHIIATWHNNINDSFKNKDIAPIERLLIGDILIVSGTSNNYLKNPSTTSNPTTRNNYLKSFKHVLSQTDEIESEMTNLVIEIISDRPNTYRTTISWKWTAPSYHDESILTMLWDFTNPDYFRTVLYDIRPME